MIESLYRKSLIQNAGYYLDENGCTFYADGPKFSVTIQTEEVITPEGMNDYS